MAKVVASDESIKECPICGSPIQKTYGCDYMMCGHSAHGSLSQAIRNGGCGVVFYFNRASSSATTGQTSTACGSAASPSRPARYARTDPAPRSCTPVSSSSSSSGGGGGDGGSSCSSTRNNMWQ